MDDNYRQSYSAVKEEKKQRSKWALFLILLLIIFLLFSLALTVFFINQRTTFFGRAFSSIENSGEVALENSYLFASPLSAQAGDKEKIRVTVFLLDNQGKGVAGQAVFLGQNEKLEITTVQGVTDDLGRAYFDIAAFSTGEYLIEARVDNLVLPQRVKLNFK